MTDSGLKTDSLTGGPGIVRFSASFAFFALMSAGLSFRRKHDAFPRVTQPGGKGSGTASQTSRTNNQRGTDCNTGDWIVNNLGYIGISTLPTLFA